MITLLPIGRSITAIAIAYSVVTCVLLWINFDNSTSLSDAIKFATTGAAALHGIILLLIATGWRKIWKYFPSLNYLLFPDLNGSWDMEVHWNYGGESGVSHARALIKQNFVRIGMDVDAPDSDSQTLIAKPKKDSETGRPILYYVFLATPKNTNSDLNPDAPYVGAAILKLGIENGNVLAGNYFTSRQSTGHYKISRLEI